MARGKSGKEPLGKPLAFRLPEAERQLWLSKVAASGRSQSEFFRECVLQNRTQVIARVPPSGDRRRLLFICNKASNNVNQLAYRANADYLAGRLDGQVYEELLAELLAIRHAMEAALRNVD